MEKQVEIIEHSVDDTHGTAMNSVAEKKRALRNNLWGHKRIKLEETKIVLNATVKNEDESGGLNGCDEDNSGWEEVDDKAKKRVHIKVSDKYAIK